MPQCLAKNWTNPVLVSFELRQKIAPKYNFSPQFLSLSVSSAIASDTNWAPPSFATIGKNKDLQLQRPEAHLIFNEMLKFP